MAITLPGLLLIILFIIIFARPLRKLILYIEELVETNTSEDRLEFHKRANEIAIKLEQLGPVRVKDLEGLFEAKGIPTTMSKEVKI